MYFEMKCWKINKWNARLLLLYCIILLEHLLIVVNDVMVLLLTLCIILFFPYIEWIYWASDHFSNSLFVQFSILWTDQKLCIQLNNIFFEYPFVRNSGWRSETIWLTPKMLSLIEIGDQLKYFKNSQFSISCILPVHLFSVLPSDGPKISGGRPRYHINDIVRVNCTSGRSKPATRLTWFINGEPAMPAYLKEFDPIITGREGLETTVLGLEFKVRTNDFRKGDMKLKVNMPTTE